jgi:chemotaxis protein MotB
MARKKAAAHHGGAWKVAYADFVTAMMALFMVLWIISQDHKILEATALYFRVPFQSSGSAGFGVMPNNKKPTSSDNTKITKDLAGQNAHKPQVEISYLNAVAEEIYKKLNIDQQEPKKPVDIVVTSDGLRVTLYDRSSHPVFFENSAEFTVWGKLVSQNLAWLIDRHHFSVTIDGHTKKGIKFLHSDYTAWELSSDRANAMRRNLVFFAVEPSKIVRITGYADTTPLSETKPEDELNQRVTLSLSLSKPRGSEVESSISKKQAADPYADKDSAFSGKIP